MVLALLSSPQKIKVIRFFLDNPNSIDTPRGVAAWANIPLSDARTILEELTKKGFLKAYRTTSTVGYSLTESKKLLKSLGQILKKSPS